MRFTDFFHQGEPVRHAAQSPYCRKEIELAVKYNKRLIPLLYIEPKDCWDKLHPAIAEVNFIPFQEEANDFEDSFSRLLSSIQKQKDYVEQHTKFLIQAVEWEKNQKQTNYLLIGEEREQAEVWLKLKLEGHSPCIPTDLHCEFICESIKNANNLLTQIFLAFSDHDEAIKEKVRKSLIREGLTIWTNKTDIKTGNEFEAAINRGIEGADTFVYLMSPDSLKSAYCQQELSHALANNKRIIPLLIKKIELELIPLQLKGLQFIDFTDYEDEAEYSLAVDKLLGELKQDPSYYEKHKLLLVKALKWQKQNENPSLLLRGYNLQQFEAWLKVARQREDCLPLPLQEEFITASLNKPEEASLEVFISYSRADSELARKLNDALQELGKTTWFDQESIATGTDFKQEIYRGIESSDNFLFIISPKSVNSPYCADEVEYAQKLNKRFVTVLHRPLSVADKQRQPSALANVQWLDFNSHGGEFFANFNELVRTLDTDRDHVRSHTKWSQRALEWRENKKGTDLLLRGSEFAVAEEWLKTAETEKKKPTATDLQKEFIDQSREAIAVQKKRDKRQVLMLRSLLAGVSVALVAAIGGGVFAWQQYQNAQANELKANEQAEIAKQQKDEAYRQKGLADSATQKAKDSEDKAKHQTEIATQQKKEAYRQKHIAEVASNQAIQSKQEAENQAEIAQQQKDEAYRQKHNAETQTQIATEQKHNAEIASAKALISEHNAKKQLRQAEINRANSLGRYSLSLFKEGKELDAFVEAIRAGKILQKQKASDPEVISALQQAIYDGSERDRLEGHESFVSSVRISPDGKILASGSLDGTIKLWNLETGKEIRTLKGHQFFVTSVSFSPDGKTLASGNGDQTIKLWNLETGKEIRIFKGHEGVVDSVSFSPDGKTLASGSRDKTIKLWNLKTGKEICTFEGHESDVWSVSISPDGKTLASGSGDKTIKLWNLETGKEIRTFEGHEMSVNSVSFSPDGKTLVSGSGDKIKLWNLETGKEIRTFEGHDTDFTSVSISSDGKTLASGSADKTIKLWNLETDKEIRTFKGHEDFVLSVNISPDGKTLASGSADKTIKLWNLETSKEIHTIKGHEGYVHSESISPDGKTLASGSEDKTIKLWNLETGKEIRIFKGHEGSVSSVSISPDGKTLASGSEDKTIKLWNLETSKEIRTFKGHKDNVNSVSISPDGKTLASGSKDQTIKLWNLETGKEIRTLKGHEASVYVYSVSISPDGKTLASGGSDDTIKLWNLETGKEIRTLKGHEASVYSVSFSPDGKTLVSGSYDKTIKLWDLKTGKEIHTFKGHEASIYSVSFSPDGKTLASGSEDKTIKLWNLETGKEIRTFKGHEHGVNSVSFSPDGKTLASSGDDGTIKLWDLRLDSLLVRNCDWVRNYLTYDPKVEEKDKHLCDDIGSKKPRSKL